jgi:hypothetical protein
VDCRADLLFLRADFKFKEPHLTGGGADQAAERLHNSQLRKLISWTTLHFLAKLPNLTISTCRQKNKTLLKSPSPGETTPELLLI